jgi:glycosyltransferase involved in cell wall biosynthesis
VSAVSPLNRNKACNSLIAPSTPHSNTSSPATKRNRSPVADPSRYPPVPSSRIELVAPRRLPGIAPSPFAHESCTRMLAELDGSLDLSRVHFLGKIPYAGFINILQVSRVHVYLTYPFVLSWSMLEAMAAGCLVVGSRTQPVEEVIQHAANGLLIDFFSSEQIADRVIEALEDKKSFASLRQNARQTIVDRFDLRSICLPAHLRLLNMLVPREGRVSLETSKTAASR